LKLGLKNEKEFMILLKTKDHFRNKIWYAQRNVMNENGVPKGDVQKNETRLIKLNIFWFVKSSKIKCDTRILLINCRYDGDGAR
jgi:hypothetical protein